MVCNDLVMPVLLRMRALRLNQRRDLTGLLLGIRRGAIVLILLLGYLYFRIAGEAYALVSIGLISFAAVAQFAPAALGGIFWKGGTRRGALAGLSAGFAGLVLHAAAAGVRALGVAADRLPRARAVRHRAAQAARAVRGQRPGPDHPRDDLEHGGEHRRLRRRVAAARAGRRGASPGDAVRRRVQAPGASRRRARLARHRVGARAVQPAGALRRPARGGRGVRRALRQRRGARTRAGALRREAARRRDRRRLGAHHARLGGEGGGADAGRGARHAGRGVADRGLQPPPGAEVAGARARHAGAARGERAPHRARPHEGRVRLHRVARAAHAAHLDPLVHRDPARQPAACRPRSASASSAS